MVIMNHNMESNYFRLDHLCRNLKTMSKMQKDASTKPLQ